MEDWPALKNRNIQKKYHAAIKYENLLNIKILTPLETPLGLLPYLEIDDTVKLVQSTSIARYLANEFNLAGADSLTRAQANAIIDCKKKII